MKGVEKSEFEDGLREEDKKSFPAFLVVWD